MESIRLKSFAKINLHLEILKTRQDGYHDIFSIMQAIDLYDVLEFRKMDSGVDIKISGFKLAADTNNLVVKTALMLKDEYKIKEGICITLQKNIPLGGGLGGGSSNAVVTMLGINMLCNLKIPYTTMRKLAAGLGADVPFFLSGGSALVKGIGDIIVDIELPVDYWLVLIKPEFGVSSRWAYDNIEPFMRPTPNLDIEEVKSDFYRCYYFFENTFEQLVFKEHPIIEEYRDLLLEAGATKALMSGSGSTIFGIFKSEEEAKGAKFLIDTRIEDSVYMCKPIKIDYFCDD